MTSARRIAVTGLGVLSPVGSSTDTLMANLAAGRSGVRRLQTSVASGVRTAIGAQVEFDGAEHFDAPLLRQLDRVSQFAVAAARQAVAASGIDFSREARERCGVFVGTGMGGAATTDEGYRAIYTDTSGRMKPFTIIAAMANAPAAWIAIEYGLVGPNLTYSTACASSAVAIGEAARRIGSGEVDVMLAGGAEAPLSPGVLRAWEALRTLAIEDPDDVAASCRPFALSRKGLVLGEGAAFVVLENWDHAIGRGARIRAELSGYGLTSDTVHITRPTAEGQASAMRAALTCASLLPQDIDYINAHGTATLQNDAVETTAIKQVFGAHAYQVAVSSTKSMHGHLLGAAGALEFVIAVLSLEHGMIPPTMHLDVPDPACDLDYVAGTARTGCTLHAVMSNSFAFGGTNAVLIVKRPRLP